MKYATSERTPLEQDDVYDQLPEETRNQLPSAPVTQGIDPPIAIPFVSADVSSPATIVTLLGCALIAGAFGMWVYERIRGPQREEVILDQIVERAWTPNMRTLQLQRSADTRRQAHREALASALAQTRGY